MQRRATPYLSHPGATRSWRTLLAQDIPHSPLLSTQLLLLTFATGIQDVATFASYHVFGTKQTGNTFFLALYLFNPTLLGPRAVQNLLISLLAFFFGGLFFSHLARRRGERRRGWLVASNLLQTSCVLTATVLCGFSSRASETEAEGFGAGGTIALLSFAGSGQIGMASGVGMAEVNTTMVTGALVQLSGDGRLFRSQNRARTRRVLFFLSFLAGCSAGAVVVRGRAAWVGLLLVAVVKAVVTVSLLWNRGVEGLPGVEMREDWVGGGASPLISTIVWGG